MPTQHPLRSILSRHHGAVRRALMARHALRAAAGAILAIVLAVALGMLLPLIPATATLRLALVILAGAAFVALAVLGFRRAAPAFDAYLERVEQRFPEIRSWLRNALDFERQMPAHGSAELAHAVSEETARRLAAVPVGMIAPRVEPRRPLLAMAGAMLAIVLLGTLSPTRVSRSWQTLWNPAIAAPPVTLAVEPGSVRVTPGAALAVRARVQGTTGRPRIERRGEPEVVASLEGEDDTGARVWRFDLSQLTRAQTYRVKVTGAASPEYEISLAGEPQALSFTFEYEAPSYARLPAQRGASTRGEVTALRGSRARIEATFDRDLETLDATLPGGRRAAWTAVTPRRWRGEMTVDAEGEYGLHARAADGAADFRYRVQPIGDAPPILTVLTPETDLDLPAGQRVPLEIVGQDDLGLSELKLQYRKDPAAPWTERSLSRFAGEPREARVATRWDASELALLPGEVASFRFELYDGNRVSGRGRTVSPVFELRFPSMTDLYEQIDRSQEGVQQALEKVSERAEELQKSLDKLARQQPRPSQENAPNQERTEEMKQALQRQQELADQIQEATEELKQTLEQSSEREAFNEELQRKLKELSELMEQIQSQELRDAMRRMQEALERMDPQAMERQLPKMQEQNREMLEQLDRSIELLKQLREEEQMQALAERAEELKRQQDALNEAHEREEREERERGETQEQGDRASREEERKPESAEDAEAKSNEAKAEQQRLAERQQRAAEQTEKLAEDVKEMQEQLEREEEREGMQEAAEELEQEAAESQREAAQQSQRQQSQQAKQSGQKASKSLENAAQKLEQMAQQRQEEREGVDLAAVRRAAKDLVSLQRTAEENMTTAPDAPERADRQTDLSEGVSRVADSLYTLAQRTPFITPGLAQSLGRAMENLSTSGRELASGNRRRGETTGREAAESLNEAILELRKSEQAMCEQPGSSGGQQSRSTAQRLSDTGEQQSQLNRETRSIARRMSEQMRLSAGDRNELQRLSEQQQRLREQIEQIQKDDEGEQKLLGRLDQAQKEMKEVEESIREGSNLADLPEKQQRILSRLLDAQRSVHRRDFDPEREANTADDVPSISAPELPADLLRQSDRLRLDLIKAEADRYPAQYRSFIEAYLRSLNGSRK
jgi:hypothetical protein